MPTVNSYWDKINGPTSKKAFRTIDRQKEAEAKRLQARQSASAAKPETPPECDWRRLQKEQG